RTHDAGRTPVPRPPAGAVPVPPVLAVPVVDPPCDDVRDSRPDLLVAPGAPVRLDGGGGRDRPDEPLPVRPLLGLLSPRDVPGRTHRTGTTIPSGAHADKHRKTRPVHGPYVTVHTTPARTCGVSRSGAAPPPSRAR